MGQIVKQVSEYTTKYIWYPGDKREWQRAAVAVAVGFGVFAVLLLLTRDLMVAVVGGTTTTAAVSGANVGRRDARALAGFPDLGDRAARRAAMGHTGKAAWRAVVQACYGAGAAVLIMNLPDSGMAADWLLPIVPAVVGGLARQAGMLYERLGVSVSTPGPAKAAAVE